LNIRAFTLRVRKWGSGTRLTFAPLSGRNRLAKVADSLSSRSALRTGRSRRSTSTFATRKATTLRPTSLIGRAGATVGLTRRRQLFVAELLANPGKPAAWAAVRAGFSEKRAKETASELLKDPEIKAAIEQKLTSKFEKVEISEKLVISGLLRAIERCVEAG